MHEVVFALSSTKASTLLEDRNGWLLRSLDRALPRIDVEGGPIHAAAESRGPGDVAVPAGAGRG